MQIKIKCRHGVACEIESEMVFLVFDLALQTVLVNFSFRMQKDLDRD